MTKQLSSFMVIDMYGGNRISYTYQTIDDAGELISSNERASFFVVDDGIKSAIETIQDYITAKLAE